MPSDARASARGSGLSTMPSPPPKGRSSTVRCRSWVKLRRSWMPTSTSPSASARRRIPFSKMLEKKPGKMVTISNRIFTDDIGHLRWGGPPAARCRSGDTARCYSDAVVLKGNIHVEVEGLLRSVVHILYLHHIEGVPANVGHALFRWSESKDAQHHVLLVDRDHDPCLLSGLAIPGVED